MKTEAKYAIELLSALINEQTVPMPPEGLNWEELFAFSVDHKVDNMVYAALSQIEDKVSASVMGKLLQRNSFAIAVEATQEISYLELSQEFERSKVRYLPLKGVILKHLYPMPEYRQSGDIDILVAYEDLDKVRKIMLQYGYIEDELDEMEIHYGYRRPPYVLVEIHKKLTEEELRMDGFFSQVWDLVSVRHGTQYQYEFDKETMYVYIISHMAKHIRNGGAGIRLVLDIWVLLKEWGNEFDYEKLESYCERANLTDFARWAEALAKMWFGGEMYDDENVHILGEYVVDSGIYGNKENSKKINVSSLAGDVQAEKKYRVKKFLKSTFLPYHIMRNSYPILVKYKFLLPVMWVHRIFKFLFDKELKASDRIKKSVEIKDDAKKLKNLWEAVK